MIQCFIPCIRARKESLKYKERWPPTLLVRSIHGVGVKTVRSTQRVGKQYADINIYFQKVYF